jgi:hypothetical protein
MIHFLNVTGQCMVRNSEDYCVDAYVGMTMPITRETMVIATGLGSHAVVDINGDRVTVPASSYIKVSPGRLIPQKLIQKARDLKNASLRAYLTLHKDRGYRSEINAVIGVRG